MSIVYVIDYLFSINGGTERQLHRLIRGMVEKGYKVRLYVFRHSEFTRNLESFECPVESLEIDSLMSLKGVRRLREFRDMLERDESDVVHGFFNDVALVFPILFLKSTLRVFTSRRDMGIWHTTPKLILLRMFFWSNARIICNCEAVADLTASREWKPRKKIDVIYNGIDKHYQKPDEQEPDFLADKLKETDGKTRVVLIANVRPIKKISDLIAAAAIMKRENVHFFIIGHISDKDYYGELSSQIDRLGLDRYFHFVGSISEPRGILKYFDVGVLCSESEGLSNTVMEYLDSGLATVISDVGGNHELVEHGVNGFLYEVGSTRELSDFILALIDDSDLRFRFSIKSKDMMSELRVPRMLEHHIRIYGNSLE
jgi:glycosyltransferase involved in cell wall biosynthesis